MATHTPNSASDVRAGTVALTVIIPMFNEAERIGATVADVCATLEAWGTRAEVLLIDDGSTDSTREVAGMLCQRACDHVDVRAMALASNRGKGAAVRTGLREARGAWALFMDADNSTRLIEYAKLREEAHRSGAPVIIGSREAPGSAARATPWRRAAGRGFHACLTLLGLNLARDTQCGFKAYRADAAALIAAHSSESGFAFDVEHLLIARRAGISVREVGVRWDHRHGGSIRVVQDGVRMLAAAVRIKRRVATLDIPPRAARELPAVTIEAKPMHHEPRAQASGHAGVQRTV